MIHYLITDGSSARDEMAWLNHLSGWMERGVDFIQIREREACARQLAELTRSVLQRRGPLKSKTKILINDRADVALACGADGVHLRDNSIPAGLLVREGWTISVSCHDPARANIGSADLILLAPIFSPLSKEADHSALGLDALKNATSTTSTPILALGGITRNNERACVSAGAAGIAGISYFAP